MKVLHLCKYDFRTEHGGIESVCKNMYRYFRCGNVEQQQNQHYFLFFSHNKTSTETQDGNCIFYNAGLNMQLGSTSVSFSYLKQYLKICDQFDIVHVHVPNPIACFAIYLKKPKGKIVVHWHSDIVKQKLVYPLFRIIEKKVLQQSCAIIATSQNYADGSKPLKPYRNKIHVIPIGIEPLAISNTPANTKMILAVGRLVYYKGFEYLIKAAQLLPDDYQINIVGSGELQTSLAQLIQTLQVSHKVKLLGRISDEALNELFNQCKVFCLPSVLRSEAFGVVLLEALRLGKPVVATNISYSGVNWVNEHNVTGLNVDIKNEQQLAQALTTVLSDDSLYKRFSKNAFNRFNALFTADKMNGAVFELYRNLMKQSTLPNQQQA